MLHKIWILNDSVYNQLKVSPEVDAHISALPMLTE